MAELLLRRVISFFFFFPVSQYGHEFVEMGIMPAKKSECE